MTYSAKQIQDMRKLVIQEMASEAKAKMGNYFAEDYDWIAQVQADAAENRLATYIMADISVEDLRDSLEIKSNG